MPKAKTIKSATLGSGHDENGFVESIDYDDLVAVNTRTIQELDKKVQEFDGKVQELEGKVQELDKKVQEFDVGHRDLNGVVVSQQKAIGELAGKIKEFEEKLVAEKARNDGLDARLKAIEEMLAKQG